MKKMTTVLLALLLLLSLAFAGCEEKATTEPTKPEAEATDAAAEETAEPEAENAETEAPAEEADASSTEPKQGGTFIVRLSREPGTYNPCAVADDAAYQINQNVFNKLLKINGNDEVIPDLAESYEYTDDGKTLTFHLHENVKWHDGEDFSAEDVKWTFDTIFAENGFASNSLSDITEVNVIDKNTVEFKLAEPNAGLLGYIAWMGTYIMPKHIYEGTDWLDNPANQHPIGTGPFKFVEQVPGQSVTIERNEDFFGQVPYLDKVVYTIIPDGDTAYMAWLNDEIDHNGGGVPAEEIPKLMEDPKYEFVPKSWPNKSYIFFNMESGRFTDPKLREAVLYGIDVDEIFVKALKEQGGRSEYFIPPSYTWALNEDVKAPARDVEKARQLIEEAGYELGDDGYYFEAVLDTYPGWDPVITVLIQNFEDFGVKLISNQMDDPTYDEKVLEQKDFEISLLGGYQGPDISAIGTRFGTGAPMNYGMYSNPEMDEELAAGNRETALEDRAVHYRRIQEILREDLPAVFFSDKGVLYPLKTYVHGHPAKDAKDLASESEYTYVWLDR